MFKCHIGGIQIHAYLRISLLLCYRTCSSENPKHIVSIIFEDIFGYIPRNSTYALQITFVSKLPKFKNTVTILNRCWHEKDDENTYLNALAKISVKCKN